MIGREEVNTRMNWENIKVKLREKVCEKRKVRLMKS
jgi:hypothetical protein